ncbi:MAG: hypothetical protein ACSLFK_08950, partial [Gemmatimonadaceae bacterium]
MTRTARWEGLALKGLATVTFLILAASACPAAEPPPAPPPPPPPPVVNPPKPDKGMAGIPGADRTTTRNYLLSLGWGDNLPDDQVVEAQVQWGNNTGTVRIVPSVTANAVSWQTALTEGPGYFVAKIYNLEDRPLGPFGLGALETGYLWVGEIGPNQRGIKIYTFKNDGVVTPKGVNLSLAGYCADGHSVPSARLKVPDCPPPAGPPQQTGAAPGPMFILASATSAAV